MPLNPIQFGQDVLDQYGRYLRTTFRLADPDLAAQLKEGLAYRPGTGERLAKGPYVYLNRPFVQGPSLRQMVGEEGLELHPALPGLFPFEALHKHQENSLRAALAGRHVLMATGTGSGKTEGFLLPILNYCLRLRDRGAPPGVAAVLIYPMNALVNDQLERLRGLLAGSRIPFGRYTGETPDDAEGARQLGEPRRYTAEELRRADERIEELPLPWEECPSRAEIRRRRPRLLLTNYAQLEYLLLRDRDLALFRDAPLRFFVLDEVHTYTGALGSEMACLVRRLRAVAGKSPAEVVAIGSSATVTDRRGDAGADGALAAFAERLFGVPAGSVELVREEYQRFRPAPGERYLPPVPEDAEGLLAEILDAARDSVLADEVREVPGRVVALAERLCGRAAPGEEAGSSLARLFDLLAPNRLVEVLQESFTRPSTLEVVLPRVRPRAARRDAPPEALQAEVLAYLTLGALARRDDEPLMRPKLHYFIQGLHGLWLRWREEAGGPRAILSFSDREDGDHRAFPLSFCRACGQHFVRAAGGEWRAVDGGAGARGVRTLATAGVAEGEWLYFTDRLLSREGEEEEIEEIEKIKGERAWLCRACGALHDEAGGACLEPRCRRSGALVEARVFFHPFTKCPACGARSTARSPVVTTVRSHEVYDVMILAQTQLASMPEAELRKVLVFADSRQDAAFQAGWMESRSLRFRTRHLTYRILAEEPARWWYFEELVTELAERGTAEGIVPARGARRQPAVQRLRWLLLEELFAATQRQRRNSLEQLGLARLRYEGLEAPRLAGLAERWGGELGCDGEDLARLVHLLLDIYRLGQAVSHPLLGRWWNEWDKEVRDGVVTAPEYFRPQLLRLDSAADRKQKSFVRGLRSSNHSTAAERFLARVFPAAGWDRLDPFLEDLWTWLVRQKLVVPRRLKVKRYGKLQNLADIEGGFQIHLDLVQIAHAEERYVCDHCGTARAVAPPGGACPAYHCLGTLRLRPRDEEHYDVVQYSRFQFVPLLSREHSAQVPREDRVYIEGQFKKSGGRVNCLVATPTLEMGVDIGPLEMVLMRNVPPSPAHYAQRAGRAGRRHRIGAIFTYCRDTQHDQYFYRDPPAMIAGEVRIPAFSMRNEPLIEKHVHSAVLTTLRSLPDPADALEEAFPPYISSYFGAAEEAGGRRRFRLRRPEFAALGALLAEHGERVREVLRRTFTEQWPEEERPVVGEEALAGIAGAMPERLGGVVGTLLAEIRAYQEILAEYRRVEEAGEMLGEEDRRRRDNYDRALRSLWREDPSTYALSYLARHGFFPGYTLVADSVRAQSLNPPLDLARNLPMAVRELTPAARLYANRRQFKVRRLDIYKLKASRPDFEPGELEQVMVFDGEGERVIAPAAGMEGGEAPGVAFSSLRLIDVELEELGGISDQEEYRLRVGYRQHCLRLAEHRGGRGGKVGLVPFRLLRGGWLRLVNLGPREPGPAAPEGAGIGFPICTVCGETRSPFASPKELESFERHHEKRCTRRPGWYALHVDVHSDLLLLGPFEDDHGAINALEAARIGARRVLEMGDQELEVELLRDGDGGRVVGVLFDPLPGGSGLLPLMMAHWEAVVAAAKEVLVACDCAGACYRCLLHFRNQQHHPVLDRNLALTALGECHGEFHHEHEIPPHFVPRQGDKHQTDSPKEEKLLDILRARGFPLPPATQHRVDLGDGSFTVADFAYPDHRLLLYVDGLSQRIHGNEEQRRRDRLLRTKAELAGWRVRQISAEGLSDETLLTGYLEELAVLLGVG